MSDWLKNRLSPVKSESIRWIELSEAVQSFWEELWDPDFDRQMSLNSIFSASLTDQKKILFELGLYYDVDIQHSNIPIAVIQRKIELFQKDSLVPLEASLRRACPGIDVRWRPKYARRGVPYGDDFYTMESLISEGKIALLTNTVEQVDGSWQIGSSPAVKLKDAVFMTSRGALWIDETTVSNPAITEASIRDRVGLVKPLHILLDEIIWECVVYVLSGFQFESVSCIHPCPLVHATRGLRVDGSWQIGKDAHLLRLDGTWGVGDGTYGVGGTVPAVAYEQITNSLVSCEAEYTMESKAWLAAWEYHKLSSEINVNGAWGVGEQVAKQWPAVDLNLYLDGSLLVDGTWLVGGEI